jgi:hypothetical protein
MPLTPASWAGDLTGAATRHKSARITKADRPVMPCGKIETDGARRMIGDPSGLNFRRNNF